MQICLEMTIHYSNVNGALDIQAAPFVEIHRVGPLEAGYMSSARWREADCFGTSSTDHCARH